MEPQVEQIYLEQIDVRRQRSPRYDRVVETIIEAAKQYPVSLRNDAICFLANSIADMVVTPLRIAYDRKLTLNTNIVTEDELFSYIEKDLFLIIQSALSAASKRERQHISATSIIVGLGQVIDHLQINSTKVWGR